MTSAASAVLAALLTIGATTISAAATFVYVSDADDATIDAYVLNMKSGALTSNGKVEAGKTVMPMAVAPNKKFLYAVVRSQPMHVITYAIDGKTGALTQKATAPLPDSMPYVSTDRSGRFLFTASYGGDKVAVSPIGANGIITAEAIQVLPTGRNAHSILADRTNRFVYSANLGANQVLQFAFDAKTGKLTSLDPPAVKPEPGHGPRHLAFSRDNKFLYVLNELSGHVTQYAIDSDKGTLKLIDSVPSVPPELGMKWGQPQAPVGAAPAAPAAAPKPDEKPPIWAADLRLTPNGKFLYTTERNTDKIALFTVAPRTGKLTYVTNFATERQPRGINIDPSGQYLVASGEKSDRLSVYRINQANGNLASRRAIRWARVRTGLRSSRLSELSQCPLLAQSGHPRRAQQCPLSGE
jgi:6-phosphogluconolactonase